MSEEKALIIGATYAMSDETAKKVWDAVKTICILENAPEDEPTPEELEIIRRYESGDPEYV